MSTFYIQNDKTKQNLYLCFNIFWKTDVGKIKEMDIEKWIFLHLQRNASIPKYKTK